MGREHDHLQVHAAALSASNAREHSTSIAYRTNLAWGEHPPAQGLSGCDQRR